MEEMHWIEDGRRFLWLSERDGWQHLYAVSVANQEISLLTPGAFDVMSIVGVNEEQGCVYFLASPANPTQRYLYRASLNGTGTAVRVSPSDQPGTHSYDFSKDGRWAFHTFSRFGQPPVIDLVQLPDHKVIRSLADNAGLRETLAGLNPCATEFFRVNISPGPPLDVWCIKPPDFDPARHYPLLIHVYGEPAGATVVDKWGGETYLWHSLLAQQGCVVVANQRFYDAIYQERYMGLPADNEAGFKDGSPITFAHQLKGNLLLVYGTGDDNCHYQNCEVLVNELIKQNKRFNQMPYPNRTHAIKEGDSTKRHLFETLTRYLEEHLPVTQR